MPQSVSTKTQRIQCSRPKISCQLTKKTDEKRRTNREENLTEKS